MTPESNLQNEQAQPTGAPLVNPTSEANDLARQIVNPALDAESITTRPYPFDLNPVVVGLNEDGNTYVHAMRKAPFEVEERRERMTEVKRHTLGKADVKNDEGESERAQRSTQSGEDVKAALRYYTDLVNTVAGYDPDDPKKVVDPRKVLVRDNVTMLDDTTLGIPVAHRLYVANNMYGGDFEVDKATRFVTGAGRTWRVHHTIGAKILADGKKGNPLFRITYELAEPTDDLIRLFRSSALNSNDYDLNGGEKTTIRTVNLAVMQEVFDGSPQKGRGIIRVSGGTVGGEPIDVRDPQQLAQIAGAFKKSVVLVLYSRILNDLGN